MWHRRFTNCVSCKTTTHPFMAKGMCNVCYLAKYRAENPDRIAEAKEAWRQRHWSYVQGRARLAREERHFSGMRAAVLARDGHKCTECGSTEKLVVHHKDGNGRGQSKPNNAITNLVTLCRACHARHHAVVEWARDFDCCRKCGTTERRHNAKGLCWHCYRTKHARGP